MIFLTEGDSAAGSLEKKRDVDNQAIFALRGKPKNAYGETIEMIYKNEDTSLIFRATIDNQTVMFLGDAFIPEGNRLLEKYGKNIKSDIVQMAHHGQNGVDKDVYETIKPKLCLWPSPQWVFDNINGNLRTLEVREWMIDIGVKHHVITGWQGTQTLVFPVDFDSMGEVDIKP